MVKVEDQKARVEVQLTQLRHYVIHWRYAITVEHEAAMSMCVLRLYRIAIDTFMLVKKIMRIIIDQNGPLEKFKRFMYCNVWCDENLCDINNLCDHRLTHIIHIYKTCT